MQIYNTPSTKRKQPDDSQEELTSPIINRDVMFSRKKKLSKFKLTNIDVCSNPVTSRFFSTNALPGAFQDKEETPTREDFTDNKQTLTSKFQFQNKSKISSILSVAECVPETSNNINKVAQDDNSVKNENQNSIEDDIELNSSQKENITKLDVSIAFLLDCVVDSRLILFLLLTILTSLYIFFI